MDVGIRELKEHLSDYLERAARGEVIRVTDRGRPKAIIAPLPRTSRLEEGVAKGWIRPASEAPPPRVRRQRATGSSTDAVGQDRGD